jgi:hypothetical protein
VCLGLSNAFRCESWEGEGTIAELTELRGVYPLLSESERAEGLEGHTGAVLRLLQETDSDQVPSGNYTDVPT